MVLEVLHQALCIAARARSKNDYILFICLCQRYRYVLQPQI
jgi:hypothetical protein